MLKLRRAAERGHHREGWLSSYHTFSFHTYYDPAHMGFRDLRVINEDRVAGGRGFGMHPHQDMEIISLVLEGQLEHRDNLGNRETIGPYQLQRITAGTGILHSEVNPLPDQEVHFLQIWILPERQGLPASYEIRSFAEIPTGRLILLASPDGQDNSAVLRQDVRLHLGRLKPAQVLDHPLDPDRFAWLQVISGSLDCNQTRLQQGDGAAISAEGGLRLQPVQEVEFLLFDLN